MKTKQARLTQDDMLDFLLVMHPGESRYFQRVIVERRTVDLFYVWQNGSNSLAKPVYRNGRPYMEFVKHVLDTVNQTINGGNGHV